ncbi:hypothetical protein EJB05_22335, partial [Eragrostis curvula]
MCREVPRGPGFFGDAGPQPAKGLAVLQDDGPSDETLVVHAGEKLGNGVASTDSILAPIMVGTSQWFKNSDDLIDFKEGRCVGGFEYGRYGNPTLKEANYIGPGSFTNQKRPPSPCAMCIFTISKQQILSGLAQHCNAAILSSQSGATSSFPLDHWRRRLARSKGDVTEEHRTLSFANVLEDKISALEKAESTLVTSSGMNAIAATLLALVPPGGHVVTTNDCYSEAGAFISDRLSGMGIRSTFIDLDDMELSLKAVLDQNDILPANKYQLYVTELLSSQHTLQVTLFYTDSPTNPLLKCVDIRLVTEMCHRKGALVCVDSTLASPVNQKPLTLGADIVLHSATKFIAGHHDVIAGCVSGSDVLISRIRLWHHHLGGAISPNSAYMIIRGLKTMALRVEAQNYTALRIACLLECHPKIERVHYPGLKSCPWHHIAEIQMAGCGGVLSFEVASDLYGTMRFIDALKIPFIATSFGGCESLVQQPAVMSFWGQSEDRMAKMGIKNNLVRFSVGIEKFEDIRDDILQALDKV